MKTIPVFNGTTLETGTGSILENRFGHACQTLGTLVGALKEYRFTGSTAPGVVNDPRLDGGAEMAFDSAIQAVLDRIERLAKDDHIWAVSKDVHALDLREAKARLAILEHSANKMGEDARPCHKYSVEVTPIDTGGFCVFLRMKDGSILGGFGDSVEDAMKAFDEEWVKKRPEYTPLPEEVPPGIYGNVPEPAKEQPPGATPGTGKGPEPEPNEPSDKTA